MMSLYRGNRVTSRPRTATYFPWKKTPPFVVQLHQPQLNHQLQFYIPTISRSFPLGGCILEGKWLKRRLRRRSPSYLLRRSILPPPQTSKQTRPRNQQQRPLNLPLLQSNRPLHKPIRIRIPPNRRKMLLSLRQNRTTRLPQPRRTKSPLR